MHATLPAALAHHADSIPDQLFTRFLVKGAVAKTRTFPEAWTWAGQWAALFSEHGLQRGDVVLLALPNCDAFVGAYFGTLMAGAVPAPMAPPPSGPPAPDGPYLAAIAERVRFTAAKALVVPANQGGIAAAMPFSLMPDLAILSERQAEALPPRQVIHSTPDDLGLLQFTSGTAGRPKAVMLTQRAILAQLQSLQQALALVDRFRDWAVSWLPLFHDMGLIGFLLTPAYAGGSVTLLPTEDFILRPSAWLKALSDFKATITGAPPSGYALCTRRVRDSDAAGYDLSALRIALVGAETVTGESLAAFEAKFHAAGFRGSSFLPTYGLAENGLAVTMPPLDRGPHFDPVDFDGLADGVAQPAGEGSAARRFTSVGPPLPATEVLIVDDGGGRLPERRIGEILVRSPSLMAGYYRHEPATREALRGGWLWTGDLGYMAGGELYITGRKKEVIIVGGRNYYPDDVEQAAGAVPGVRKGRVVAIGCHDPERATERLIVLAETDSAGRAEQPGREALGGLVRQALSQAGYPVSDVVLLPPKAIRSNLAGKVSRIDCKARYLAGEFEP